MSLRLGLHCISDSTGTNDNSCVGMQNKQRTRSLMPVDNSEGKIIQNQIAYL